MASFPLIIQGGMGAGVSNWRLANAVSATGQLGVVSGTALDVILVRRLQDGDPGGHVRRALDAFPFRQTAERIWNEFYIPGGKAAGGSYVNLVMHTKDAPPERQGLIIAANFVEVWLAREGHGHPVGINYLEKIQMPHLASIYGAMLAGVDYVLMGAGIPLKIPGVLDAFVNHQAATYPLAVIGKTDETLMHFDPRAYTEAELPPLKRPQFLAIISSNTLATTLVRKANGAVNGFIVETDIAGGHNAPPRGKLQLSERGEPVYGERDQVDCAKLSELKLPFWLAGGYGRPGKLAEARARGAAGVQVGTAFAYCVESGLREDYRRALLDKVAHGTAAVFTDPLASPTGFPFKVAQLEGTMSEQAMYEARQRGCDLGYLRQAYSMDDGEIGYRCAAEPPAVYLAKGGKLEDTEHRKCVCNGLMANIGLGQTRRDGYVEPGIVTSGNDLVELAPFLAAGGADYAAADVISVLLAERAKIAPSALLAAD
jgi:nitronate monooxygenase